MLLELGIAAGRLVVLGQLPQREHQGLGDEASPVGAEAPLLIGYRGVHRHVIISGSEIDMVIVLSRSAGGPPALWRWRPPRPFAGGGVVMSPASNVVRAGRLHVG